MFVCVCAAGGGGGGGGYYVFIITALANDHPKPLSHQPTCFREI